MPLVWRIMKATASDVALLAAMIRSPSFSRSSSSTTTTISPLRMAVRASSIVLNSVVTLLVPEKRVPKVSTSHRLRPVFNKNSGHTFDVHKALSSSSLSEQSHRVVERAGAPGRTRTCNPLVRSQVFYPVELRVRGPNVALGPFTTQASTAQEPTWYCSRMLIVGQHDLSCDNRVLQPVSRLLESARSCRQVVHHFRQSRTNRVWIKNQ